MVFLLCLVFKLTVKISDADPALMWIRFRRLILIRIRIQLVTVIRILFEFWRGSESFFSFWCWPRSNFSHCWGSGSSSKWSDLQLLYWPTNPPRLQCEPTQHPAFHFNAAPDSAFKSLWDANLGCNLFHLGTKSLVSVVETCWYPNTNTSPFLWALKSTWYYGITRFDNAFLPS